MKQSKKVPSPEIPTLEEYVDGVRTYLQAIGSKYRTLLGSYATELDAANPNDLDITKSNDSTSTNSHRAGGGRGRGRGRGGQNGSNSGRQVPTCLCGQKHWFANCFYINKDAKNRPPSFKGDEAIRKRVAEGRKKDGVEQSIQNSLKRFKDRQNKQNKDSDELIDVDDGSMPTDAHSYFVTAVPYSDDPFYSDSESEYQMVEHKAPKTHRVVEPIAPTAYQVELIAPNSISSEKERSTIDLTVMASAQEKEEPDVSLINRIILDPGSNTHVINSNQWVGWTQQKDGQGYYINAGNSRVPVQAWGEFHVAVNTPTGQRKLRLTNVAYAPGFLTSLMGLSRCRSSGIHFDSGEDILYRSNGDKLARLQYHNGYWLVDANLSRRPNLELLQSNLSTFSSRIRPSRVPKPPSLLHRKIAYQVWAHPGERALEKLETATRGV